MFVRNQLRQFKRLFSTKVGEITTESTTKIDHLGQKQTWTTQITNVKERWSKLSPTQKYLIGTYGLIGFGNVCLNTYDYGKSALVASRDKTTSNQWNQVSNKLTEWEIIRQSCREHTWSHLWNGVVWPYSVASNTLPYLVLWLNPLETK